MTTTIEINKLLKPAAAHTYGLTAWAPDGDEAQAENLTFEEYDTLRHYLAQLRGLIPDEETPAPQLSSGLGLWQFQRSVSGRHLAPQGDSREFGVVMHSSEAPQSNGTAADQTVETQLKELVEKTVLEHALEETKYGRCARAILRARRDQRVMDEDLNSEISPLLNAMARAIEEGPSGTAKRARRSKPKRAQAKVR